MDTRASRMNGALPRNPVIIQATIEHMQHTLVQHLGAYEQEMQEAIAEEVGRAFAAFDIRAMIAAEVKEQMPNLLRRIIQQAVTKAMWSEELAGMINDLSLRAVADILGKERP